MSRFTDREPVAGASSLWQARDGQQHGRAVALRRVDRPTAAAVALRTRMREVAQVRHATLARLVAVGEEDGALVVARQWVDGAPLQGPLAADAAADLFIALLDGVELAHWHDLTHGHITPDRIIVGEEGPVLVGLGLEGQGSVQGDLRAVVDAFEAVTGRLPDRYAQVVAAAHQGTYATARDLQEALRRARAGGAGPFVLPLWARVLAVAALGLLVGILGIVSMRPGPEAPPAPPPSLPAAPVPVPEATPPVPAPVPEAPPEVAAVAPSPRPSPVAPEPVPVPLPEPQVIQVVQVPAPAPTVRVSAVPAPAPVPAPVPAPAPVAPAPRPLPTFDPGASRGAWEVHAGTDDSVLLRLAAEQSVTTRAGQVGRPVIEVRCRRGKATVSLDPGVPAVETVLLENGSMAQLHEVRASVQGRSPVAQRWKGAEGSARLELPKRELDWFVSLEREQGVVALGYTPFASDAVLAGFRWTGFEAAVAPWRSVCGFD